MSLYDSITVGVKAHTKPFAKGLKKATGLAARFGTSVAEISKKVAVFGAVAGAAGVAGLAVMTKRSLESIDLLAKTSDKLGIATEKLQAYRHAAELSGVGSKAFDTSLQRMVRRLSEVATTGGGPAAKALAELGINIDNIKNLSPDEQLKVIADAMKGVSSQADKVRLAFALFDSEGVGMVNMLRMGSTGLDEASSRFDAMGLAISRVDAAQIEMANNAVADLKALLGAVADKFTVELAPYITVFTDYIRESMTEGFSLGATIESVFDTFMSYAKPISAFFNFIESGFWNFKGVVTKVFEYIMRGIQGLLDSVSWVLDKLGIEWETNFMGLWADELGDQASGDFKKSMEEFDKAMSGNSGQGFKDRVAKAKEAAKEAGKNATIEPDLQIPTDSIESEADKAAKAISDKLKAGYAGAVEAGSVEAYKATIQQKREKDPFQAQQLQSLKSIEQLLTGLNRKMKEAVLV